MNQIVRRVAGVPTATKPDDNLLPARTHRSDAGDFSVTSQLALGIDPRIYLSWSVPPWYFDKGYLLLVFHSITGLSPERYPDDLNRHGQLIIETNQNASYELHPTEGMHFYSCVLHRKGILFARNDVARFSETVPSGKVAISRIKDKIDLQDMLQRHEVAQIEHEAKVNEARRRRIDAERRLDEAEKPREPKPTGIPGIVHGKLTDIDALVDALVAKRQKIKDLKEDPRFKKLSREDRKAVIEELDEALRLSEINAGRDVQG